MSVAFLVDILVLVSINIIAASAVDVPVTIFLVYCSCGCLQRELSSFVEKTISDVDVMPCSLLPTGHQPKSKIDFTVLCAVPLRITESTAI